MCTRIKRERSPSRPRLAHQWITTLLALLTVASRFTQLLDIADGLFKWGDAGKSDAGTAADELKNDNAVMGDTVKAWVALGLFVLILNMDLLVLHGVSKATWTATWLRTCELDRKFTRTQAAADQVELADVAAALRRQKEHCHEPLLTSAADSIKAVTSMA